MIKQAAIIIFLFSALDIFSQQNLSQCDSLKWAKEGTYEIISHTKEKEVFTTNILCIIETNRKDFEFVELQVRSMTTIRIFPRERIKKNTS